MKKILILLTLTFFITTVAYAKLDFSIGGGIFFNNSNYNIKYTALGTNYNEKQNIPALGVEAFIDGTYFCFDMGLAFSLGGKQRSFVNETETANSTIRDTQTWLHLNLMGKYPFLITEKISLFPLVGIEYRYCMTYKDNNGNNQKSGMSNTLLSHTNNEWWLNLGVGADFDITDSIYIRPIALLGFRFHSEYMGDMIEFYEGIGGTNVSFNYVKIDIGVNIGFRL